MAHPKRRQSKTRTLKRRTHDKAVAPTLAVCPNCGGWHIYHTVCPTCGYYRGKLAIVNSCAHIGNDCIINTRALIEHGCTVHDHANLSTNTVINGDVEVGCGSFIGSCSVTIGQLRIGNWSTVGAGAVVTHSVGDGVTVAGVPAVEIRKGAMLG